MCKDIQYFIFIFCFRCRETETDREELPLSPQMLPTSKNVLYWRQKLGTPPRSPMRVAGIQILELSPLSPRMHINRKLEPGIRGEHQIRYSHIGSKCFTCCHLLSPTVTARLNTHHTIFSNLPLPLPPPWFFCPSALLICKGAVKHHRHFQGLLLYIVVVIITVHFGNCP